MNPYELLWHNLPPIPISITYPIHDKILCLIPIFTCNFYKTHKNLDVPLGENRIDAFAKCAVHSWYTWREHSDAKHHGIAVKIYLEDVLCDRLLPFFHSQGISENEIITFSAWGDPMDWGRLGKQMFPYWDERFSDYDWLVVFDCDFFVPAIGNNFFARLDDLSSELQTDIGFCNIRQKTEADLFKAHRKRYLDAIGGRIAKNMTIDEALSLGFILDCMAETRSTYEEICKRFSEFGLEGIIDLGTVLTMPFACIWVYPAKYTHRERKDFVNWMRKVGPVIGSDQLTAVLWNRVFGYQPWSIERDLGIGTHKMSHLVRGGKINEGNFFHGRPRDQESLDTFLGYLYAKSN